MINPKDFNISAFQAADRYTGLLQTIQAILFATFHEDPTDMRVTGRLKSNLFEVANRVIQDEVMRLDETYDRVAVASTREAEKDLNIEFETEPSDFTKEYVEEVKAAAGIEIAAQAYRDVQNAMRAWRDFSLDYYVRLRSGARPEQARAFAISRVKARTTFYFLDRGGKRWPAATYIKSVYRHYMLILAFETYIIEANHFQASYLLVENPKSNADGDRLEFVTTEGGKIFADIREEVFHPNSNATLKAVA